MAPTASAHNANIASLVASCSIPKPSFMGPMSLEESTSTFSKDISEALRPSTVGKFSISTPLLSASTRKREIPFLST